MRTAGEKKTEGKKMVLCYSYMRSTNKRKYVKKICFFQDVLYILNKNKEKLGFVCPRLLPTKHKL